MTKVLGVDYVLASDELPVEAVSPELQNTVAFLEEVCLKSQVKDSSTNFLLTPGVSGRETHYKREKIERPEKLKAHYFRLTILDEYTTLVNIPPDRNQTQVFYSYSNGVGYWWHGWTFEKAIEYIRRVAARES